MKIIIGPCIARIGKRHHSHESEHINKKQYPGCGHDKRDVQMHQKLFEIDQHQQHRHQNKAQCVVHECHKHPPGEVVSLEISAYIPYRLPLFPVINRKLGHEADLLNIQHGSVPSCLSRPLGII